MPDPRRVVPALLPLKIQAADLKNRSALRSLLRLDWHAEALLSTLAGSGEGDFAPVDLRQLG